MLEIIKDAVFNRQDPIIIGVKVKAGFLKIGTPLCIPEKDVSFSFFIINFLEFENWCGREHGNQQESCEGSVS